MSRYLDPKADIVFKRIFGDHPNLLISFLNAVLPLASDAPIVTLTYLPSEQVPVIPEFKHTIADVKCTDAKGRIFIVEMQMNWTDSFKQRLLFGVSQAFVKQLEKGRDYKLLQPVYGLGLVAEIYDKENSEWYHHYQLVKHGDAASDTDSDVIEHLQLVFIELPKFPVHSRTEKQLRLLWLRFLREIDEKTKEVSKELLEVPEIAEAIHLAEEAAYTPSELDLYETYWDSVRCERTFRADAFAKGMEQGKVEGELKKAHEIAKKMLFSRSFSLEAIAEVTGLSLEELSLIN